MGGGVIERRKTAGQTAWRATATYRGVARRASPAAPSAPLHRLALRGRMEMAWQRICAGMESGWRNNKTIGGSVALRNLKRRHGRKKAAAKISMAKRKKHRNSGGNESEGISDSRHRRNMAAAANRRSGISEEE